MRYCLIVNPHARGGRGRALAERCVRYLAQQGCGYDTEMVQEFQQASTLSQKANQQGYDVIVAVGGDGTLNKVLNGFYGGSGKRVGEARLGVLHTGTSPDFCQSYGIPLDLHEAVRALVRCNTRAIPVGRIRCAEHLREEHRGRTIDDVPNPKVAYFACCANIGLGAALARRANAGIRRYLGDSAGTFVSLLQVLREYHPGSYDVVQDAEPLAREKVINISIGLTHHIASGIKSYKGNMDAKNRFYVMTVHGLTLRTLPPMLYRVYRGQPFADTAYLSMGEAGTISVHGTALNPEVEYDGDPGGYLPCAIDLASDRLDVVV